MQSDRSVSTVSSQLRSYAKHAIGVLMLVGWLIGIPAALLLMNWGKPLYGTRTVTTTTTQTYGLLIELGGPLLIWFGITFVVWGLAIGVFPTPPRRV